ncbi:MAG: agmatinase [Proteobacteria bacterium]|nr:agmatinase [Pseudomonadota bacterium]
MKGFPSYPLKDGFLGIDKGTDAHLPEDSAVVIPFGLEPPTPYRGTARGPSAILKASQLLSPYDIEQADTPYNHFDIETLKPFKIEKDILTALDQLEEVVSHVIAEGRFPLTLGGSNAVTLGAIRPLLKKYPDLVLLSFNSHACLQDGKGADTFAHKSILHHALQHKGLNLVLYGVRDISSPEVTFMNENKNRIRLIPIGEPIQKLTAALKGKIVYLSFDVDVWDPSLMPATALPEPGGMFWKDTIEAVHVITEVCTVVGADIVELLPTPGLHAADYTVAKLAYSLLSSCFKNRY